MKTLGIVMIGIFLMFLILFRNTVLSLIGIVPNFIAAFSFFRNNWLLKFH